jgi:hypothetical protein
VVWNRVSVILHDSMGMCLNGDGHGIMSARRDGREGGCFRSDRERLLQPYLFAFMRGNTAVLAGAAAGQQENPGARPIAVPPMGFARQGD